VHTDLVDKIIKRVREVSMERGGETFKHLAGLANARNTTMLDEIIEGEILGMGRRRMDAKNRAGAEWKTLRRKQTARQKLFK
jgi:hypothetical protein